MHARTSMHESETIESEAHTLTLGESANGVHSTAAEPAAQQ